MISSAYIAEMASYSRWQNDSVYDVCDRIGPEERTRDRGLFFGSIHNTLDHICGVNQSILTFLDGSLPARIVDRQPKWPEWARLKSVRLEQDKFLADAALVWSGDWLSQETVKSDPKGPDLPAVPRWVMVVQLFNHQTHHRSQVTTALHSMGERYGSTDIPWRPGAGYFAG